MGKECEKLEILKVFDEEGEEEKGDEIELSLELSIGGRYGKTENSKGKICGENVNGQSNNFSFSRSNFSSCVGDVTAENGCESVDLQRRREIQALRRQEARRKREEKVKKSRGQNGVGFVEDKLFLEAQKLQARVQERETRERESFSEEKARKKEKKGSKEVGDDLSLSLFTDNKTCSQQAGRECLYPKVQYVAPRNGVQVLESWGPNVPEEEKKRNSSVDCDSEHSNGMNESRNRKSVSNRSVEHCSSAVSDYQSVSHKGGSSSDTGSHSSSLRPRQHPDLSGNALDQLESHDSSSQTETDQVLGGAKLAPPSNPQSTWSKSSEISKPDSSLNQTNNTSSTSETLSKETSGDLNDKPPRPSNYNTNAASIPHMPCVSATGNGPNGKTITGFLYKYTKTAVSIMCVCHGSSFSPAEFVEHAGGVDISHPLKHITVVPSAFR